MQSNANKEEKNIVERWDWADQGFTDNYPMKRYCRKLRRRKQKAKFKKDIRELLYEEISKK